MFGNVAEKLVKKRDSVIGMTASLFRNEQAKERVALHLTKALHNLEIAQALIALSQAPNAKLLLRVSSELEAYDWAIAAAYYAMYQAVQAALAHKGYISKSHTASIRALERLYVNTNLEVEYLKIVKNAKEQREDANYEVTMEFKKIEALELQKESQAFVKRITQLLG